MTSHAPIVLFAYNRPEHLRKTLEFLARAEGAIHSELWIFCDGPKGEADSALTEAVRAVARDPKCSNWFRATHIETSETNKGLAGSIIGGVTKVMETADRAIVVEDDLLVAPDFVSFMNNCLDYYADDQGVGSITGFSPLKQPPNGYLHDVMAVPRNSSQGWATWTDRWIEVDWEAKDANRIWNERALRHQLNSAGSDRADRLRRQLEGKIDSWSIRFGLFQTVTGRVTIYPARNRVQNIGYDGSGVHSGVGTPKNERSGSS